jgi:hypothetical protein
MTPVKSGSMTDAESVPSAFSAAASQSGLSFQILVALEQLALPGTDFVVLEGDEDICSYVHGGVAWAATQTKFHGSSGTVAPRGRELWKTLRIWSGLIKMVPPPSQFRLVTSHAVVDSGLQIANLESRTQGESAALEKRLSELAAQGSEDEKVQGAMDAWKKLGLEQRLTIAASMVILQASTSYDPVREACVQALAVAVGADDDTRPLVEDLIAHQTLLITDSLGHQAPAKLARNDLLIAFAKICFTASKGTPKPLYGATAYAIPPEWQTNPPRFIQHLLAVKAYPFLLQDAQMNYIRADNERRRIRRSPLGKSDLDQLDEALHVSWRAIWADATAKKLQPTEEEIGLEIFRECCKRPSAIGNRPTHLHEHEGGLHHLSHRAATDPRAIGWHPKFPGVP